MMAMNVPQSPGAGQIVPALNLSRRSMRRVRRVRSIGVAAWLLAVAILPSLLFSASWHGVDTAPPAAASGPSLTANSFAGGGDSSDAGEVRQCLPDTATCDDLPAASAAAIVQLERDVIAAVASQAWTLVHPPAEMVSRDAPTDLAFLPPRS
jgi:hypothetical protein